MFGVTSVVLGGVVWVEFGSGSLGSVRFGLRFLVVVLPSSLSPLGSYIYCLLLPLGGVFCFDKGNESCL